LASDDMSLAVDADMLDLFRMEAEANAAVLEKGLMELETGPQDARKIEPLMRAAHSIKGAARIVGVEPAVQLAHLMEDLFTGAQKGLVTIRPEVVDALLQGVDVFKRISAVRPDEMAGWFKEHAGEIGDVGKGLSDLISGRAGTPPSVTPPAVPLVPFSGGEPAETTEAVSQDGSEAPGVSAVALEQPVLSRQQQPLSESGRVQADGEQAVLVTARNINRLMGLAGECLVESRFLKAQVDKLYQLKSLLAGLPGTLEQMRETCPYLDNDGRGDTLLGEALEKAGKSRELLARQIESFDMYLLRWENLSSVLYNETVAVRMRPFKDGGQGFPRMVRDMARRLGKKIRLDVSGELTKVDRDVLARLEAPLTHILRNSCDHGLESSEERIAAGKPEEGTIRLEASHGAGMLSVTVSDDGRGINPEQIRGKVVEKGLISPETAASLSEQELMDFLFLSGFSTARTVTETSGRGVGLDVVRNMIQEVRGTVNVTSRPGHGTTFHLQLPLTLSVLRTLLVEIAREPYAFPLARVDRVLVVSRDRIELIEDRQYFPFDGQNIGLVPASQPLGLESCSAESEELPVVVVSDRLNQYGIVVDCLLGEYELVVRPLDPRLGKVPDISAAGVKEDGSPVLIIDVDDLVRSIDNTLRGGRINKIDHVSLDVGGRRVKRVLVVDDSITVREVERRLLANKGYEVDVAVDGMDGWNGVRNGTYDLVVSDIDMPRMNGIEMVRNIKSDPALKHLPVIIVSYKDREEDRLTGMEAGASAYLTKSSFYDESFVQVVVDLIGEP
jgi:two-component system, chemotaxis family, sensor histidine kinase and response regulator WspE